MRREEGWKGTTAESESVLFDRVKESGWRVCRGVAGGQAAPQVEKDRSASSSGSKTVARDSEREEKRRLRRRERGRKISIQCCRRKRWILKKGRGKEREEEEK